MYWWPWVSEINVTRYNKRYLKSAPTCVWFTNIRSYNKKIKIKNNKYLKRIINSHNSGSVISEQRNQSSVPYHNPHISPFIRTVLAWTLILIHSIISGGWVIAYFLLYWTSWLEKTAACLWLNRIDIKPVTCNKGCKVPFAVTRHKWWAIPCQRRIALDVDNVEIIWKSWESLCVIVHYNFQWEQSEVGSSLSRTWRDVNNSVERASESHKFVMKSPT